MSEPIFDPAYWSGRLAHAIAREQAHYAVFEGSVEKWNEGRKRQEVLLGEHIGRSDSILDIGCGWGRLLGIMPKIWVGDYLGIDICLEFVSMARLAWPDRQFFVEDFRHSITPRFGYVPTDPTAVSSENRMWDWAVCCSIKPMIVRNAGKEVWDQIEVNIRKVADKILLLGYDDLDDEEGVI